MLARPKSGCYCTVARAKICSTTQVLQHASTVSFSILVWVPEMLIDLIKWIWSYTRDHGNLYIYIVYLKQLGFTHAPLSSMVAQTLFMFCRAAEFPPFGAICPCHFISDSNFPPGFSWNVHCLVIYLCRVQGCGSLLLQPVVFNRGSEDRSVIMRTQ